MVKWRLRCKMPSYWSAVGVAWFGRDAVLVLVPSVRLRRNANEHAGVGGPDAGWHLGRDLLLHLLLLVVAWLLLLLTCFAARCRWCCLYFCGFVFGWTENKTNFKVEIYGRRKIGISTCSWNFSIGFATSSWKIMWVSCSADMLVVKTTAGVAPEIYLKSPSCVGNKSYKGGDTLWLWNQGKCHQKWGNKGLISSIIKTTINK